MNTIHIPPLGYAAISSSYLSSLPKAGSTLLEDMMREGSAQCGLTMFSPAGEVFKKGRAK